MSNGFRCQHSRAFLPLFDEVANELLSSGIVMGRLDVTADENATALAGMYRVQSYPTLVLFRRGVASHYDGPRPYTASTVTSTARPHLAYEQRTHRRPDITAGHGPGHRAPPRHEGQPASFVRICWAGKAACPAFIAAAWQWFRTSPHLSS